MFAQQIQLRGRKVMRPLFTDARNINEVLDFLYKDSQEMFSRLSNVSSEEVLHIIKLAGGFWRHNDDPKAPHAVLRSGKHSDGFISAPEALKYTAINNLFANLLVSKLKSQIIGAVHWVVGSDHAAATFSYAVANRLAKEFRFPDIKHDFTEKGVHGRDEIQKWTRHTIGKYERVLHIEEVSTTLLTVNRVHAGIADFHRKYGYSVAYVPVLGMLVNRTGRDSFGGFKIEDLLKIRFPEWDVKNGVECERCRGGSEPLENVKKDASTWAKLTGRLRVAR